jgi:IS1 family transposase
MVLRLQNKKIQYLCTDDYDVYKKIQIAEKHVIIKAETSLVEAKNSSLRGNLARLNRRTKRFNKSIEMLNFTIILFVFWKNYNIINVF